MIYYVSYIKNNKKITVGIVNSDIDKQKPIVVCVILESE